MILHSPSGCSNSAHFLPSALLALDDPFVNMNMFEFTQLTHDDVQIGDPSSNCILSPVYTPRSVLEKYPRTRLMIAEVDPVRDFGLLFALSLYKAGKDIEVFYFKEYISNFWAFDSLSFGIPEFRQAYQLTIEQFKHLLA
jgi:acetyl esterase/lipase